MEVKTVLLVGGSPEPSSSQLVLELIRRCDIVVAVDHGLDAVLGAGLGCDLFVGDADSVSPDGAAFVRMREEGGTGPVGEVLRFDPHKDDTDLALALSAISERWPDADITCTCVTGGRPDHALAVLGRLASCGAAHLHVREDAFVGTILHDGQIERYRGSQGLYFSFVPLSDMAEVSETGMRWTLEHKAVPLLSDLGISNVIDEELASITCHTGTIATWLFL